MPEHSRHAVGAVPMFGWFNRKKRQKYVAGADRADRNAVIQRIVSAAAAELKQRGETPAPTPSGGTPSLRTADGLVITPLPAGKPPSGVHTTPAPRPSSGSGVRPVPGPPPADPNDDPPPDAVARRAMEIWVRRGRPTGTAEQDWQQAVMELKTERAAAGP